MYYYKLGKHILVKAFDSVYLYYSLVSLFLLPAETVEANARYF